MAFDVVSYALSKKYTADSVIGLGAIKGANCTISNITDNSDGTHTVVFQWKDTNDVSHTSRLNVSDGENGIGLNFSISTITNGHRVTISSEDGSSSAHFDVTNGVGIASIVVNDENHLIITYTNGTSQDAGVLSLNIDGEPIQNSDNLISSGGVYTALTNKVDKVTGKQLSTNDYTTSEKNKLANIEDNAEVNVIEKILVNGTELTITDKQVEMNVVTTATTNLVNYYLKAQVYTKDEVNDLIATAVGITISIVDELPTEGQSNIIYFVATGTNNVYSQYIWYNGAFQLIGSTEVDLTNYYTKTQTDTLLNTKQDTLTFDAYPTSMSSNPVTSGGVYTAIANKQAIIQYTTLPTASVDLLGKVYQYIGESGTYTQDMFYRCAYNENTLEYYWDEVSFNADITVDGELSSTSENPVQNKVIYSELNNKQNTIQYSTMPTASADNVNAVIQYIGVTGTYRKGSFYRCVYDSTEETYSWTELNPNTIDTTLSSTSENAVQNKVIYSALSDKADNSSLSTVAMTGSYTDLSDLPTLGTAAEKNWTSNVREGSHDLVDSNAVYSAIASTVSAIYTPHGDITVAELVPELLITANIGNVYTVTDSGTTTSYFVQGAGKTISEGVSVSIIKAGEDTILFNLMSNMVDLSDYQKKELDTSLTIDGTEQTTVEDALGGLNTLSETNQSDISAIEKMIPYGDNWQIKTLMVKNLTGSVKYIKVATYNNDTSYPFIIRVDAQRVNTTVSSQQVSCSYYNNSYKFALARINTPIYSTSVNIVSRNEETYLIVDADNVIWVALASYSCGVIQLITPSGMSVDGTEGTPTTTYKVDGYSDIDNENNWISYTNPITFSSSWTTTNSQGKINSNGNKYIYFDNTCNITSVSGWINDLGITLPTNLYPTTEVSLSGFAATDELTHLPVTIIATTTGKLMGYIGSDNTTLIRLHISAQYL